MTTDPAEYFDRLAAEMPRCFWLDGGGAREWSGRMSLAGRLEPDDVSLTYDAARREVTRHRGGTSEVVGDDVFAVLEAELAAGDPSDQWFGYLGYAARPDLPATPDPDLPDAVWMRPSHVRLFEHPWVADDEGSRYAGRSSLAPGYSTNLEAGRVAAEAVDRVSARDEPTYRDQRGGVSRPPQEYERAFAQVQEQLHAGNSYEVNLTYRADAGGAGSPVAAYQRLRTLNPAPYAGFLQHDIPGARAWLLSSSPERYALVSADRHLETKPIKGTTPRGADAAEDERNRRLLAEHPKYRAENLMIVDLLRNDLSLVCEPGTVQVPRLMEVESYATVHQLVSTVRGRLRDDVSTVAALRALFPAGSMTGAPKLRTMEIIREVESTPRGVYSGAFGWLSGDGRADLGVVIRSLMTTGDGRWQLGTGGGITVQSDLDEEWAESLAKADRLRAVFDGG